jgi:membrane protein insertase Oxa1/YidC/SpoIIIJ
LFEPLSQTIHWGFQELHTQTGLPWYLTIPLGAAILRMTFVPLHIWAAQIGKPREAKSQIMAAWRKVYQDTAVIKYYRGTESDAKKANKYLLEQIAARGKEIDRHRSSLSRWSRWVDPCLAISFLPIWIAGMDSMRVMSGDTRTVMSLIFNFFGEDTAATTLSVGTVEPGFVTETLSWIPSLASADPEWILPLAFATVATHSIRTRLRGELSRPTASVLTPGNTPGLRIVSSFFRGIAYTMLFLPTLFAVIMIHNGWAAALVLFVLGNSVTQHVQRSAINRLVGTHRKYLRLYARSAQAKEGSGK